jgi:very-short-patch-repair endonuclease
MPSTLLTAIRSLGSIAHRGDLADRGHGRREVESALRRGDLLPVRNGWVATPSAAAPAVVAVLHGGALTGSTALRSYGVWAGNDLRIHVQLRTNSHRRPMDPLTPIDAFQSPRPLLSGVARHWGEPACGIHHVRAWRVCVLCAIVAHARKEHEHEVQASIESAVHVGALSRSQVSVLFSRLPRRLHAVKTTLDFRPEAGWETVVRLRLLQLGVRIEIQVVIGPYRVDLLIDGWLVIELDGTEFHDPVKDKYRDGYLIRAGYRPIHWTPEMVRDWPACVAVIEEMLLIRSQGGSFL